MKTREKTVRPCRNCGRATDHGWTGVASTADLILLVRTCRCRSREVALMDVATGDVPVRVPTELTAAEAARFSAMPPISDDEVIAFQEYLWAN